MEFTVEQQAELDRLIGEARVKARDLAKAEFTTAQTKAQADADRAALEAKNEWQTIAAEQKSRITSLEAAEAKVKTYETLVDGMLADRIKALGDAAKTAVSALPESLTPIEKLTWLNKNVGLFSATSSDGVGTPERRITQKASDKKTPFEAPLRL